MRIIKKLHYEHMIIEFDKLQFDGNTWSIFYKGKYIGAVIEHRAVLRYYKTKIIEGSKYIYFNMEVQDGKFI